MKSGLFLTIDFNFLLKHFLLYTSNLNHSALKNLAICISLKTGHPCKAEALIPSKSSEKEMLQLKIMTCT